MKISCKMELSANKTPVEVIREGAFGGTYFTDIYSSVNGKWYKEIMEGIGSVLLLRFLCC